MKIDNMKRKIVAAILILFICGGLYFVINSSHDNEQGFDIPKKTKYIITYSTGETKHEKSIVNYLDSFGNVLGRNQFNHNVCEDSISYSPVIDNYMLFTHEEIYFNHDVKPTLSNNEMQSKYKFASENGMDEVYASGYVKEWNLFYKHIPHGLAYAESELGYFDLLTFFNEKNIYNVRIKEGGIVADNQSEHTVYNFYGESGEYVYYEALKFDEKKKDFLRNEGKIDLTDFMRDNMPKNDGAYTIGKTLAKGNRIYQILELGEKSIPYLLEYKVSDNQIAYENSYKMELKSSDYMGAHITAMLKENKIIYYSVAYPNAVIIFDCKQKEFKYQYIFEEESSEDSAQLDIREIDGDVYVLKPDIDNNVFEIFQIKEDGTLESLIKSDLPKVKIFLSPNFWVSDFYVLP